MGPASSAYGFICFVSGLDLTAWDIAFGLPFFKPLSKKLQYLLLSPQISILRFTIMATFLLLEFTTFDEVMKIGKGLCLALTQFDGLTVLVNLLVCFQPADAVKALLKDVALCSFLERDLILNLTSEILLSWS